MQHEVYAAVRNITVTVTENLCGNLNGCFEIIILIKLQIFKVYSNNRYHMGCLCEGILSNILQKHNSFDIGKGVLF